MFRKSLSALTLAAFLGTNMAPAFAADFNGISEMRYNPYAAHSQASGTTAGLYLRIPFRGGVKHPKKDVQLGLALGTRLTGIHHAPGHFAAVGSSTLIDMTLDISGNQSLGNSLRFYGETANQIKAPQADKKISGKKRRTRRARARMSPAAARLIGVSYLIQVATRCRAGSTSPKCR